jgi:hypothetical protein
MHTDKEDNGMEKSLVRNDCMDGLSAVIVDSSAKLLDKSYWHHKNKSIKFISSGRNNCIYLGKNVLGASYDPFKLFSVDTEMEHLDAISRILIPSEKHENDFFVKGARQLFIGLFYSMYSFPEEITFVDCLKMICSAPIEQLIETFCIGSGTISCPSCEKGWMLLSSFYSQATQVNEAESFANVRETMQLEIGTLLCDNNICDFFDISKKNPLLEQDIEDGDIFICLENNVSSRLITDMIVSQYMIISKRYPFADNVIFLLENESILVKNPDLTSGTKIFVSK